MRSRACFGRGASLNRSPSSSQSPARTRKPSPSRAAGIGNASTNSSAPSPPMRASALNGGRPSSRRRRRLHLGEPTRVGCQRRLQHLVLGAEGLHQQPVIVVPWAEQPGCPHEQRHRLLGRPVTRCEQFGVDVEERDDVGLAHPVEHRLGAQVHARVGHLFVAGPRDGHHRSGRGLLELVAQPRHARAHVGQHARPARLAHGRTGGATAATLEHPVVALLHRRPAPFTPEQRPARATRQQPGVTRRVVHAHHPQVGIADRLDQPARHQRPLPRLVTAAVDQFDDRPPLALVDGRRAHPTRAGPGERGDRRAGRHEHHRHAQPTAALDRDVTGVPGGGAFLLQRLVVLVEHHDRRQVGHAGPHPAAGTDHHLDGTRCGRGPAVGQQCDGTSGPAEPRRHQAGAVLRRVQHEHPTELGGGQHDRRRVVARRDAHHAPAVDQQPTYPDRRTVELTPRRVERSSERRHHARRPGGHEQGAEPPGAPPVRRPVGQVDDLVGGAVARPLGDRDEPVDGDLGEAVGSGTPTRSTQPPTRRPCRSTRTSEPIRTRSTSASGTR
jgi:hypothetical protein